MRQKRKERNMAETTEPKKELTLTRIFNAPRDMVWKAWTDPKLIEKWWGPRGVTNPICEWDARPGGLIHIVMLAGKDLGNFEGQKWPMKGTFREVTPKSRIVYESTALDDVQDILIEHESTIDFQDLGDKTKMTMHIVITKTGPKAAFAIQGMQDGWNQCLDKLAEELEK